MTEPFDSRPRFDDAPTTPTQQTPPPPPPFVPVPPHGPQSATPTAWQPAGWSGTQDLDPISWTPAGQQPAPPKRGGRGRWIVALLATVLIVVAAAGVAVFALSSKTNAAIGPTFLPASTPMYVEARLDLPGAQRDNVIKLLGHFPGFADPSSFDQKVDETFDKLVKSVSSDAVTYTGDVKPWFSGQISIGLLQIPSSMTSSMMSGGVTPSGADAAAAQAHVVVGIGIKDRSKLDTLLTTIRALPLLSGVTFGQQQVGDHTVVTVTRNAKVVAAYSVSDTLLLLAADPADLTTSLDVLDGKQPSLAADAGFTAAAKDLPAERLGALYLGPAFYQASADSMTSLQGMLGAASGQNAAILKCVVPSMPDASNSHTTMAIVANGDSVSFQTTSKGPAAAGTTAATAATDLAAHMPADVLFYAQVPGVGGAIHDLVACLRTALPDAFSDASVKQIETAIGTKLEDFLSFVTDVGIGVSFDGTTLHWGIVTGVNNEDTAKERVNTLVSAARLAAGLGGSGGTPAITVTEKDVSGTTVTTLAVTPPANPGMAVFPNGIETSISVAVGGGHLYLGDGDFTAAAVSRAATDSLSSNQRYSSALSAAGNLNGALVYVDIDGIRQRVEALMPANPDYTTNVQPYLKPFDRLIIGANDDAGTQTGHILVFVK